MQTTGPEEVFPEPAAPLRPARGRLTAVFLLVVAAGLGLGRALSAPGTDGGAAGLAGTAPEVVMAGFDGIEWRLSTHLIEDGRPVLLNLWASWCLPCRDEIPALSAFAADHPGVAVIGVAVNDQPEAALALANELRPTYRVGIDRTGRLRDRYPSVGIPLTVLIDSHGIIRWSKVGGATTEDLSEAIAILG